MPDRARVRANIKAAFDSGFMEDSLDVLLEKMPWMRF